MVALFRRSVIVQVGTLEVTGLRVVFKVEKKLTKDPNKLALSIYNLNAESRARLQSTTTPVRLIAGYIGSEEQLFIGDVSVVGHSKQGVDWISSLQSGDGQNALRTARINESFAKDTTLRQVFTAVVGKMQVGVGNAFDELAKGNLRSGFESFKGLVVSGVAADAFDQLTKTAGFEWSVQDGFLQVIEEGKTVGNEIVILDSSTGLIGSPEVGEKGIVKARSLIQQRLSPGKRLRLASVAVKGDFRIEKVTHTGDTHGTDWFSDLELKAA